MYWIYGKNTFFLYIGTYIIVPVNVKIKFKNAYSCIVER